jgi:hypothetical protein
VKNKNWSPSPSSLFGDAARNHGKNFDFYFGSSTWLDLRRSTATKYLPS